MSNEVRRQQPCSWPRYIYLHSVRPKYLSQHPILKHPQPVFSTYEREIIVLYILNFRFLKANGKTERSRGYENFSLLLIFHEFIFDVLWLFPNIKCSIHLFTQPSVLLIFPTFTFAFATRLTSLLVTNKIPLLFPSQEVYLFSPNKLASLAFNRFSHFPFNFILF